MVKWELPDALALCRELSPQLELAGYGLALAGSVLVEGSSRKDVDLVVFPLSTAKVDIEAAYKALSDFGMRRLVAVGLVHSVWRSRGSDDTKHVEV